MALFAIIRQLYIKLVTWLEWMTHSRQLESETLLAVEDERMRTAIEFSRELDCQEKKLKATLYVAGTAAGALYGIITKLAAGWLLGDQFSTVVGIVIAMAMAMQTALLTGAIAATTLYSEFTEEDWFHGCWWQIMLPAPMGLLSHRLSIDFYDEKLSRRERVVDEWRYGLTWETATKDLQPSHISDYWSKLGLGGRDIHNIQLTTEDPMVSKAASRPAFELARLVKLPTFVTNRAEQFAFSDMSDEMHVESIYKRFAGHKKDIAPTTYNRFVKTMEKNYTLPLVHKNAIEHVLAALATEGSAGEFAKTTILSAELKNKTDLEITNMWLDCHKHIVNWLGYTSANPEDMGLTYQMYRKVEVLPLDETGAVKITRLIQAPLLPIRIADRTVFGDYNDAIVDNRPQLVAKLGENINEQLPLYLDPFEETWKIVADFSDFDGTQHPMHMMACKYVRMRSIMRSKLPLQDKLKQIAYMRRKYMAHVERTVESKWKIKYRFVGQLASGDIVTSDDNSMKSATFLDMVFEDMKLKNAPRFARSTGDDVSLKQTYEIQPAEITKCLYTTADNLGWKLKELIYYDSTPRGGVPICLGHSVEAITVTYSTGHQYETPALVRVEDRLYGKMIRSAELQHGVTTANKQKTVAKMMSYMFTLWAMPEVAMVTAGVILQLNVKPSTVNASTLPYSWMNLHIDLTKIDLSAPVEATTGHKNSGVHMIVNPNRPGEQQQAAEFFATVATGRGLPITANDIYKKGRFYRKKFFYIFKTLLADTIPVTDGKARETTETKPRGVLWRHCPHIEFDIVNQYPTDNVITVVCSSCKSLYRRPNVGLYRVVYKGHVRNADIYKKEELRQLQAKINAYKPAKTQQRREDSIELDEWRHRRDEDKYETIDYDYETLNEAD